MRRMFLKSNIARAKDILQTKGIRVLCIQQGFGIEFELTVESANFERTQQLLAAAGIQVGHGPA
jgi:hypothetical protein